MDKKIEVYAMQYRRADIKVISERLGVQIVTERRPDGNSFLQGNAVPLVEGDWIVKRHKGADVVSEKFFQENYVATDDLSPKSFDLMDKPKAEKKLSKAIKKISNLPYSKERDYILHNLQKSLEALKVL